MAGGGFGGAVKLTGESEYRRALNQITQSLKEVSSEMKLVTSQYDTNDKSAKALTAQQEVLSKKYSDEVSKINILKQQYEAMSKQYDDNANKHKNLVDEYNTEKNKLDEIGRTLGETSEEYKNQQEKVDKLAQDIVKSTQAQDANEKSMSRMRIEINKAEADANNTAKEMDNLGKETEEAGKQAQESADGGWTMMRGILADLASSAIKNVLSGLKKLGGAVVDIGKQAYANYSNYEQLVGGIETLFKDSSSLLINYANNAYKTAGISANEYMEQATSFSATLLQGLGGDTAKAVEYANMAIIDMADNVNKMGGEMSSVQNAYQGFAKQNYQMLDNLKLGYGGTASEMARLINDSGVLGKTVKVTAKTVKDVPFATIIDAIHRTQEQIGITGATALEASSTIEGSTKSIKSAWQNLLTGLGDENADLRGLTKNLVDGVVTLLQNMIPRVKQIIQGMITTAKSLLRQFAPELANTLIPAIEKIINGIREVATFISKNFPTIVDWVTKLAIAFGAVATALTITSTISAVTTALAGLEAGVGAVTKAQAIWNAVMSANPIGALVVAIGALVAGLVILNNTMAPLPDGIAETTAQLEDERDRIEETTQRWHDLEQAQAELVAQGMGEMEYYQNLADELKTLVDENGNVKKGYEDRVAFITSELSKATGIEIEQIDGVIQNYQTLRSEIDKTLEKKKAQILLDSQETLYKEAIIGQKDALVGMNEAQDRLNKSTEDMADVEGRLNDAWKEYNQIKSEVDWTDEESIASRNEEILAITNTINELNKEKDARQEQYDIAKENYDKQEDLVKKYAFNIGQYEKNMQLAHNEAYDLMTNDTWDYVKEFEGAGDAKKKQLQTEIDAEKTHMQVLYELYKSSGSDLYKQQFEDSAKRHKALTDQMKQYETSTEKGLDTVNTIWEKSMGEQLSEITGANWEFKRNAEGLVQAYCDGIAIGEPKTRTEMENLVKDSINELTKNKKGFEHAGEDFVIGVKNGVDNKKGSVFTTIKNFGKSLLGRLKSSLQEQSPSKATDEMGQFLLMGLDRGIKKKEQGTLKDVSDFGASVIDALNSEMSQGIELGNVSASMGSSSGANVYDPVSAFKEALGQMKIVLDDEEVGTFIDKTVTNLVYAV